VKPAELPPAETRQHVRGNILGIGVSAINMTDALVTIDGWVKRREPNYVVVTPAHAVMNGYRDPELRGIFNASGLTTPDGMAIVWALRLQGHRRVSRVYGPDLMQEVCRQGVDQGYRHFLYGGEPGVAEQLADRLTGQFPRLRIAGTYGPPFGELAPEEDRVTVERINASQPDIVWVGLGSPRQEFWMAAHLERISAPVMIGVGAAFDFLSGRKPQAPRWMQRSGLEWLFRLATEPRRLWPRYRQYPWFVVLLAAQAMKLIHVPLDVPKVDGASEEGKQGPPNRHQSA